MQEIIPAEVKQKVKEIEEFAKGKRGIIFTGKIGRKKVAIKVHNPRSEAHGNIKNEGEKLDLLNRYKIGPKLLFYGDDYLVYEFVEGEFIPAFTEQAKKWAIKRVLIDVLMQCHLMDRLKLNKEEMHRPFKHIVISRKGKVTMLDFERCKHTDKPQNVTQFCQYLTSSAYTPLLTEKNIKIDKDMMMEAAKEYKQDISPAKLRKIILMLK